MPFRRLFFCFFVKTKSMISRVKISILLKYLTIGASLGGVLLSLIYAKADGYSHWARRLLYFTAQSNIWLGLTFLGVLLLPFKKKNVEVWTKRLYLLKYIFTVSITITGLVFCALLAPFADENYRPWGLCNLLTHVFSPLFAIADFFIDPHRTHIRRKEIFLTAIPPLAYFSLASLLSMAHTDFGRGVNYPYFFLDFTSPAGVFGFASVRPFVGSFYWFTLFSLVLFFFAYLYARLRDKQASENKN